MSDRTRAGANLPRTELLAPLGLAHATFETDASGDVVCGSYLWATPREWAAIGQFALDDGVWNGRRLLPEGWMSRSTTVSRVDATEEAGYAAGWWANQMPGGRLVVPELPADAYWASGHDGQWIYRGTHARPHLTSPPQAGATPPRVVRRVLLLRWRKRLGPVQLASKTGIAEGRPTATGRRRP